MLCVHGATGNFLHTLCLVLPLNGEGTCQHLSFSILPWVCETTSELKADAVLVTHLLSLLHLAFVEKVFPGELRHLEGFILQWLDIFCANKTAAKP